MPYLNRRKFYLGYSLVNNAFRITNVWFLPFRTLLCVGKEISAISKDPAFRIILSSTFLPALFQLCIRKSWRFLSKSSLETHFFAVPIPDHRGSCHILLEPGKIADSFHVCADGSHCFNHPVWQNGHGSLIFLTQIAWEGLGDMSVIPDMKKTERFKIMCLLDRKKCNTCLADPCKELQQRRPSTVLGEFLCLGYQV